MTVRVDIPRLHSLANSLENLQKDIHSISDSVVSASDSVLKRVSGYDYAPLLTAREKALKTTMQMKELTIRVCDRLTQQTETLRSAAVSYHDNDKITTVN